MKVFLRKFLYSVMTIFISLFVGAIIATKYPGAGVLVFLFASIVGVILVIKKKTNEGYAGKKDTKTTEGIEFTVEVTARYQEPPPQKGYKIPPRPIGTVQFIGADEKVEVHGYHIQGPIWVGPLGAKEIDNEPAVIDRKQSIDKSSLAEPLGFWSNYSHLNSAQRNRYLEWLSEERGEIDDLGYVFIYFYGMERYVLRCEGDDRTLKEKRLSEIKNEIERLMQLFSANRSFDTYSNQLLDLIYIIHWPARIDERKVAFPTNRSLAAHYVVAKHANTGGGEVLDSDWALQWLLGFGGVSRTKTIREQYPVLRLLFKANYLKATNGGLKVPKCKTKLRINFHPASRGLEDHTELQTPETWCDPTSLKRPLTKLLEVHDEVMPSLRALAKAIAKKDITSILSAWPTGVSLSAVPKLKQIVERVDAFLKASPSNTIEEVARCVDMSIGEKATISQLKILSSSLESCGYVLVPDPAITPTTLKVGEHVLAYSGARLSELSPEGQKVALTIQLGALLALVDGTMHQSEKESLFRLVNSHPNGAERVYLEQYCTWRSSHPPSAAGAKKNIDKLSAEQKHEVAQFLIDLALADGELPAEEIKQLEKVFKQLGLGEDRVAAMLHRASSSETQSEKFDAETKQNKNIQLDANVLKAHEASTREVQKVLGSIFSDDDYTEAASEGAAELISSNGNTAWHCGRLDEKHDALSAWLLSKDEWKMAEIKDKCMALGILVDGALDTINNVSFDLFGDNLLDVGDPVEVYKDILPA